MTNRLLFLAAALLGAAVLAGACGYALEGRGSFLPPHIRNVGIPTFENLSSTPGIAEIITAEIHSEFISRGNFSINNTSAGVDAVLEGTIRNYSYIPRALDEDGIATSFLISITADITFRDLVENKVIWEQKGYRFYSEYQLSDAGGDFINQESESVRRAAEDFAKRIVGTILTGF